jgi:hypothetical protein
VEFSYYAYYIKLLKCRAVVRSCKTFLLRVVAGWCSCKKDQREHWWPLLFTQHHSVATEPANNRKWCKNARSRHLIPLFCRTRNFIRFERAIRIMQSTDKMIGKRKLKPYIIVGSRLLGEPYLHITQRERVRRTLLKEWLHTDKFKSNAYTNTFHVMLMLMTEGWM